MQVRVIAQKGLNIREKPDLESDIIEKVPQGALLEADEITWAHIALPDGREGWAASQRAADTYLVKVDAKAPA
jgi:uncharacterized protein YgiM (DUF1202 family)